MKADAMKLAFLYDFPYPWHVGGIEKIIRLEAEALARNAEVHFFTMLWPGMQRDFTDKRIHYHASYGASVKTMYRHRRRSIRKAMAFGLSAFRLFRYRFDVVIIDQFPLLQIFPVLVYRLFTGCKMVMKVAEVWDRDYWISYAGEIVGPVGYAYSRLAIRSADAYVAASYATAGKLEAIMHIDQRKISVFSPVLDTELMNSVKKSQKAKKVQLVFFGRFIKEKRIDKWIAIMGRLVKRQPNVKGILIGDGPELASIKALIRKSGLQKKISIMPPISSTKRLYSIISASSATLNMSEREGLSIMALESLALETPVVLPDYSPIPIEVKKMCIVADEQSIPAVIADIMEQKGKPMKNTDALAAFETSGIKGFYARLFKKLGVKW